MTDYVQPNDIVRITDFMTYEGTTNMLNTYVCKYVGATQITDTVFLAGVLDWIDGVHGQMDDIQANTVAYGRHDLYNITQDRPMPSGAAESPTIGGVDVDPVAPGVAALVSKPTGTKRSIGKTFIGGLAESMIDGGLWTTAAMTTLDDIAQYLVGAISMGSVAVEMGIWDVVDSLFRKSTSYIIKNIPSYQRRRKQGVGY